MSIRRLLSVLLAVWAGVAAPAVLHAQVPALDSAQRAAMQASLAQVSQPAEFVLQHRAELALTGRQVSALEALAVALRDSASVRQARVVARMRTSPPNAAMLAVMSWSGPVDEAALRAAMCQQADYQVETMIGLARDRRTIAAVLTPAQRAQLPALQTGALLKAVQRR